MSDIPECCLLVFCLLNTPATSKVHVSRGRMHLIKREVLTHLHVQIKLAVSLRPDMLPHWEKSG